MSFIRIYNSGSWFLFAIQQLWPDYDKCPRIVSCTTGSTFYLTKSRLAYWVLLAINARKTFMIVKLQQLDVAEYNVGNFRSRTILLGRACQYAVLFIKCIFASASASISGFAANEKTRYCVILIQNPGVINRCIRSYWAWSVVQSPLWPKHV